MDPLGREEMLELIGRIAASNKSILVSSHILQDMENVCQYVIIINNGRSVTQGTMASLLDQDRTKRKMTVRGSAKALQTFSEQIRRDLEVTSISEEFGQMTIVLINDRSFGTILDMAKGHDVQVRSYLPDRLTLEDVFIRSMRRDD